MGIFNRKETATSEKQVQVVSLNDLLASTAIATVQAGATASREFYDNLCNIGFEKYDPQTNTVSGMRTLTFEYPYRGKMEQVSVPILSLVPLTMLQVEDADFTFDVQIADMDSQDSVEASVEVVDASAGTMDVLRSSRIPNLRVTLLPPKKGAQQEGSASSTSGAGLSIHITFKQSDVPGGMARFLQVVNNMDFNVLPDKQTDDSDTNEYDFKTYEQYK